MSKASHCGANNVYYVLAEEEGRFQQFIAMQCPVWVFATLQGFQSECNLI